MPQIRHPKCHLDITKLIRGMSIKDKGSSALQNKGVSLSSLKPSSFLSPWYRK